jgi:hypothetical protein
MPKELRAGGTAPAGLSSVQVPATAAGVAVEVAAVELVAALVVEVLPAIEEAVVTAAVVVLSPAVVLGDPVAHPPTVPARRQQSTSVRTRRDFSTASPSSIRPNLGKSDPIIALGGISNGLLP